MVSDKLFSTNLFNGIYRFKNPRLFFMPRDILHYVCIFEFCVDLISQDQECSNDHFEEIFVAN